MRWRSVLILLFVGFLAGAAFFYLLGRGGFLGLPTSPFGDETPEVSLLEEAAQADRRIESRFPELERAVRKRKRERGQQEEIRLLLYEHDLRDLVLAGLSRRPEGRRVLELAHGMRAEIRDGEIGFELTLNLSEMPRDRLSEKELEAVEKIEDFLPVIGKSDLPIGFYGTPVASSGKIRLGGQPRVELSILKLSLGTLGERLGIPVQELEDSLEFEWPDFEVLEITARHEELELVVRPAQLPVSLPASHPG